MPPHPDICYLRPLVFESHLECTYVCTYVMIETPHSIHTHSRSSLYIYNAIQHLRQWLQAISMPPHPDICYLRPESGCCWRSLLFRRHVADTQPFAATVTWILPYKCRQNFSRRTSSSFRLIANE